MWRPRSAWLPLGKSGDGSQKVKGSPRGAAEARRANTHDPTQGRVVTSSAGPARVYYGRNDVLTFAVSEQGLEGLSPIFGGCLSNYNQIKQSNSLGLRT